mmetsp:Transcript_61372/g.194294  ORF Transcript_61372/g.194294 Transcript_61372/m.194294 type:complete len:208 (+) Transcript_61372:1417-2040(+)
MELRAELRRHIHEAAVGYGLEPLVLPLDGFIYRLRRRATRADGRGFLYKLPGRGVEGVLGGHDREAVRGLELVPRGGVELNVPAAIDHRRHEAVLDVPPHPLVRQPLQLRVVADVEHLPRVLHQRLVHVLQPRLPRALHQHLGGQVLDGANPLGRVGTMLVAPVFEQVRGGLLGDLHDHVRLLIQRNKLGCAGLVEAGLQGQHRAHG